MVVWVEADADVRIRALLHSIPHEHVSELFNAADVFVLARSEAWTSGSLVLALSQGLPVIAARSPRHEGPLAFIELLLHLLEDSLFVF